MILRSHASQTSVLILLQPDSKIANDCGEALPACIVDSATKTLLTATRMAVSAPPFSANPYKLTHMHEGHAVLHDERFSATDQHR